MIRLPSRYVFIFVKLMFSIASIQSETATHVKMPGAAVSCTKNKCIFQQIQGKPRFTCQHTALYQSGLVYRQRVVYFQKYLHWPLASVLDV